MKSTDHYMDALSYAIGAMTMGCDIHQYAEVRINGIWTAEEAGSFVIDNEEDESPYHVMTGSGNDDRNYYLFGTVSQGVRWDNPLGFPQKGLPTDISPQVEKIMEQWDSDGHSHNYLTFKEIKEKLAEWSLLNTTDSRESAEVLNNWMQSFRSSPAADEDRRVVFCFDN